MASLAVVWFVLMIGNSCSSVEASELINTTSGVIRGMLSKGVHTYLGIPYAESPVGERRFRPAELKHHMDQVYDATRFGPICPQDVIDLGPDYSFLYGNYTMKEDCLVLNVYVPQSASRDNRKAVMVWIHGGGYTTGTGNSYDASILTVLNNVIVVTINYRIGILGFLNTMDDNAPGNLGLRDQLLALEWVQKNIVNFGGDKDRVTLFGVSAGAGSVTQLALSPMGLGLFHRIIAQSGSPLSPWSREKTPVQAAKTLAKRLSCPTNNTEDMVSCLRRKPVEDFMQAQRIPITIDTKIPWVPAYGNEFIPFTENEVRNSIKNLTQAIPLTDIDMIIGICSEEGALFYNMYMWVLRQKLGINDERDGITEEALDNFISSAAKRLARGKDDHEKYFLPLLKYRYTDWNRPKNGLVRSSMAIQLIGDSMFNVGAVEFARLHASLSVDMDDTRNGSMAGGATYFYRFNQRGDFMTPNSWRSGADHGDDVFFVFGYPLSGLINSTTEEKRLSIQLMTYWANFAKTGNPTEPSKFLLPVRWPQFNTESEKYMDFDFNLSEESVKSRLYAERIAFWTDLIPQQQSLMAQSSSTCDSRESNESGSHEAKYSKSDSHESKSSDSDSPERKSSESDSHESKSSESDSHESKSSESGSRESKSSESVSHANKSGESDSHESKSSESDSHESKSSESHSHERKSSESESHESKSSESDSHESKSSESDSHESKSSESDSRESKSSESDSHESKSSESDSHESKSSDSDSHESKSSGSDSHESKPSESDSHDSKSGESDSHESKSSERDSHESKSSDSDSHESKSSDSDSHESKSSESDSHESKSSESDSHESKSSDSDSHESKSSDSDSHESKSSDSDSHESKSSESDSHESKSSKNDSH